MEPNPAGAEPLFERATAPGGVRVLWRPSPGTARARLVFRTGVVDESVASRGTTHLVEHLAHAGLGFPAYPSNACVEALFTSFDVHGTPEEVHEHLHAVCAALSDLPTDGLAAELSVLELEARRTGGSLWDDLRTARHGYRGWGLLGTRELGLLRVDATRAREWSRRRFTVGNAVLWMTGGDPGSLDLPLPAGPARPVREPPVVPHATPGRIAGPEGVVALTALGEDSPATLAGWWWLHRLLRQRLRGQDAAVYDVDASVELLAPGQVELALAACTTPERGAAVLRATWEVIASACARDMPEADLRAWRGQRSATGDVDGHGRPLGDDAVHRVLDAAARDLLLTGAAEDADAAASRDAAVRAVTPGQVRSALTSVMSTVLLQVPIGVDPPRDVPPARSQPTGAVREGSTFVAGRHLDGGQRLVVGPTGVMVEPTPAVRATVLWADCVAVLRRGDGRREVVGADATTICLDPADWAQGRAAVAALDAVAPPHVVIDLPGGEQTPRQPPWRLSGLASMSTVPLVVLTLALSLFTLLFVAFAAGSENPVVGWAFAAVCVVATTAVGAALVERLRAPRTARTNLSTRARSHLAVRVDQALARGSRRAAITLAVGAWIVAAAAVLLGVRHGVALWPAVVPAAFAVRAGREASRRGHR